MAEDKESHPIVQKKNSESTTTVATASMSLVITTRKRNTCYNKNNSDDHGTRTMWRKRNSETTGTRVPMLYSTRTAINHNKDDLCWAHQRKDADDDDKNKGRRPRRQRRTTKNACGNWSEVRSVRFFSCFGEFNLYRV